MLEECISHLLEPIVRFCIRRSLGIQALLEAAKRTYVRVAIEELERSGSATTLSKVKLITGLHRKDVKRLLAEPEQTESAKDIVSKVIGQWTCDKDFLSSNKEPRILSIDGEKSDFYKLVRKVSRDVYPKSVLSELERKQAIEIRPRGVRLVEKVNRINNKDKEGFQMLARHVSEVITVIEENLRHEHTTPNLHARTYFDNVNPEHVSKIREWLMKEGSAFHHRVQDYVSQFDLDINPKKTKTGGVKVAITSFGKID